MTPIFATNPVQGEPISSTPGPASHGAKIFFIQSFYPEIAKIDLHFASTISQQEVSHAGRCEGMAASLTTPKISKNKQMPERKPSRQPKGWHQQLLRYNNNELLASDQKIILPETAQRTLDRRGMPKYCRERN